MADEDALRVGLQCVLDQSSEVEDMDLLALVTRLYEVREAVEEYFEAEQTTCAEMDRRPKGASTTLVVRAINAQKEKRRRLDTALASYHQLHNRERMARRP